MRFGIAMPLKSYVQKNIKIFFALDVVPAFMTIIGNSVFLLTLIRTRSLHKPSNILLGALCISDLLVGLVSRPLYISLLIKMLLGYEMNAELVLAVHFTFILCCGLSFNLAVYISIDRYVAICHPFFYQQFVTCKKYTASAIAALVVWLILAFTRCVDYTTNHEYQSIIFITISVCSTTTILVCYAKIFAVMLKQSASVQNMGTLDGQNVEEIRNRKKERTKTYMVALVIGFFLLCYTPLAVFLAYLIATGASYNSDSVFIARMWVDFFILLNSCVNPVIYCVKSTEIRHACKKIFTTSNR